MRLTADEFLTLDTSPELRAAAIAAIGEEVDCIPRLFEEERVHGLNRREEKARLVSRLAVALDDLELAREIDLAGHRAACCAEILSRRGQVAELDSLVELGRTIGDPDLRRETLVGLSAGTRLPEPGRALVGPVKDMTGGKERDLALEALAVRFGIADLPLRMNSPEIRCRTHSTLAEQLGEPSLARRAMRDASRLAGPDHLFGPVRAIGRLDDRDLYRRTVRTISKVDEIEPRITLFDLLGGCSLKHPASRHAWKLITSLPVSTDLEDDWYFDGTRDIPLALMAVRHRNVHLLRHIQNPSHRESALARIAAGLADPSLAMKLADSTERAGVLLGIASRRRSLPVLEQAVRQLDPGDLGDSMLVNALVIRIDVLHGRDGGQSELPLGF